METAVETKTVPGGLWIVLEGLDSCGKSTLLRELDNHYNDLGYTVVTTFEPGGTPFGQGVRQLFFDHHDSLAPRAEVGLLLTAKAHLLRTVIEPALAAGSIVICDRYTDSLFAYQGFGKGHDLDMIQSMIEAFYCDFDPDYTLLLNVSPETSMTRGNKRKGQGGEHNSLDDAGIEFRRRLMGGFQWRFNQRRDEVQSCIDAEQSIRQVYREAWTAVDAALAKKLEVAATYSAALRGPVDQEFEHAP